MKPTYKTVMSEGCEHLGNAMDFKVSKRGVGRG